MSDTDLDQTLRALADEAELAREDTVASTARRKTRPAADPSQVYSVRIPVDRLEQLWRAAAARGSTPPALIRELVVQASAALWGQTAVIRVRGRGGGASA